MDKKRNKNIFMQTLTKRNKKLCKLRENKGDGIKRLTVW